jgi:hypothetical protein
MFTVHPRDLPGHRWSSATQPRAVPPRRRTADSAPLHRNSSSATSNESVVVVSSQTPRQQGSVLSGVDHSAKLLNPAQASKSFSIDDLVAHCKTTAELEAEAEAETMRQLNDPAYRKRQGRELREKKEAGIATDMEHEQLAQIASLDALHHQATRMARLQAKQVAADAAARELSGLDVPQEAFMPASTFEGAREGFAFQCGEHGLGYYKLQPTAQVGEVTDSGAGVSTTGKNKLTTLFASKHNAALAEAAGMSVPKKGQKGQRGKKKMQQESSDEDNEYDDDGEEHAHAQQQRQQRDQQPSTEENDQPEPKKTVQTTTAFETDDNGPWQCGMCLQQNSGGSVCAVCATARSSSKTDTNTAPPIGFDAAVLAMEAATTSTGTGAPSTVEVSCAESSDNGPWQCGMCLQQNSGGSVCAVCATARPSSKTDTNTAPTTGFDAAVLAMEAPSASESTVTDNAKAGSEPTAPEQDVATWDASNFHEEFVALARVFCGTLHIGAKVYVVQEGRAPRCVTIGALYTPMGRALENASAEDGVRAGNICCIGGLSDVLHRCGTLAGAAHCPPFRGLRHQTEPIVRVAVSPDQPQDLATLANGLQLLTHADPAATTHIELNGEHVLVASGEVHLQVCLKDLRERFARVPFQISPPVVPFRETVNTWLGSSKPTQRSTVPTWAAGGAVGTGKCGDLVLHKTPCGEATIHLRAVALPQYAFSYCHKLAHI